MSVHYRKEMISQIRTSLIELCLTHLKRLGPNFASYSPFGQWIVRRIVMFYAGILHVTSAHSEDLAPLATRRLQRLIHIARHSPFWKKRLSSISDTLNIRDITKITPVTKTELVSGDRSQYVTRNISEKTSIERRTSGSTGMPLSLFIDKRTYYYEAAAYYVRMLETHGVSFSQLPNTFFFMLNYYDARTAMFYPFLAGVAAIDFFLKKEAEKKVCELARNMEATGGCGLFGHPPDLILLAQHFEELKLSPPLRFIMVTGQLLEIEARKYLEQVFGCPVVSYYGTQEAGLIATQCPKNEEFHVSNERIYIEILGENLESLPDGKSGMIAMTCFDFTLFPIIRYLSGDRGKLLKGECPGCKSAVPRIQFEGRETEFILLQDGTKIPERRIRTQFLTDAFIRKVRQFQVRQISTSGIEILVVPSSLWDADDKEYLLAELVKILPKELDVVLKTVANIERTGNKIRSFVPLERK